MLYFVSISYEQPLVKIKLALHGLSINGAKFEYLTASCNVGTFSEAIPSCVQINLPSSHLCAFYMFSTV